MSLLSATAEYSDPAKPPKAETILKLATHLLKTLRAIEKEQARLGNYKYRPIEWSIRIFQFADRAIVELDAPRSATTDNPLARAVGAKLVKTAMPDLKGIK